MVMIYGNSYCEHIMLQYNKMKHLKREAKCNGIRYLEKVSPVNCNKIVIYDFHSLLLQFVLKNNIFREILN